MKNRNLLFVVLLLLFSCGEIEAELPVVKKDKPIRQLVEEIFPEGNVFIGATSHYRLFGSETIDILDREFSYVTPANDFKQTYIHPYPGKYQYKNSDAWIEHCRNKKQVIRLHAPISPQASTWVKTDSRTPEELEQIMEEYMIALCTKYASVPEVKWLDVVNETIDKHKDDWFGPKPGTQKWENPWPIMGYDETHELNPPIYIKKAFQLANQYAPHLKLIINQHGALEKTSWERMKKLVAYLRENDLRVDGLGWQAHIDLGWENIPGNPEYLAEIIQWCHKNDLEFHITEFNVWLKGDNAGKLDEQAETFTAISKVVIDKRSSGIVGINFWQIRSSETMNKDWDGCLFNENLDPKPAYFRFKELLETYR